jgi:hypothetical protein
MVFRAQHSHPLVGLRSVSLKKLANHPRAILFQFACGVRVQTAGGSVGTAATVIAKIPYHALYQLDFFFRFNAC